MSLSKLIVNEAIEHINQYGSNHTEAIITDNSEAAKLFQQRVNSSIVMHNCSTQFADGGEFGMGAEMDLSNGRCRLFPIQGNGLIREAQRQLAKRNSAG